MAKRCARAFRGAALWLALGLLAACSSEPAPDSADGSTASGGFAISVAEVESGEWTRQITASGPVAAWEEMQLGVELSGVRITEVLVDVGEQVRKGQVLLTLDHRTLDSDLRQAEALLAEAEAGVALAQSNLRRGEELHAQKLVSTSAWDELRAAEVQARTRLATARASADAVRLRRSFAELRAPDDGVIASRMAQPGQVVGAGVELLRLIRNGRLEWRGELGDADLAAVQVGAAVLFDRGAGAVAGKVRAVSPGVDAQTRTGTVYVDLPEPGDLRPGMYVQGRIDAGRGSALTVPTAAVVRRDGKPWVFVIDEAGIAHLREVAVTAGEGGRTRVQSGLKAGERVALRGAGFLNDGDRVRVIDAAPAPEAAAR